MKIGARVRGFGQTTYDFLDGLVWVVINSYNRVAGSTLPPEIRKELTSIARTEDTSVTQVLREMLRQFLQLYQLEFAGARIFVRDAQGEQTLVLFRTHRKIVDTTALDINIAVAFGRAFVPGQLYQTLKEAAQSGGVGESTFWRMVFKTGLVIWETQRSGGAGIFYQKGDEAPVSVRLFAQQEPRPD